MLKQLKSLCIAIAVLLVTLCPTVQAEVRKGEIIFGPHGLYALPTDDYPSPRLDNIPHAELGSDYEPGLGLALSGDRVMSPRFSLGGEFKVFFGTVDETVFQEFLDHHVEEFNEAEYTWRTVHFGARARYYMSPEARVTPFLHAGAGLYLSKLRGEFRQPRLSGSSNSFVRSESKTSPGLSLGTGTLVRLSKDVRLSFDAIFTNVFSSERNIRYVAVSTGLIFSVLPEW